MAMSSCMALWTACSACWANVLRRVAGASDDPGLLPSGGRTTWNRTNSDGTDPVNLAWFRREIPSWGGQPWPVLRVAVEQQINVWFAHRRISCQWTRQPTFDKEFHNAIYYKFNNYYGTATERTSTTERMSGCMGNYANAFLQDVWTVSDNDGCLTSSIAFHGAHINPTFEDAMRNAWATDLFEDGIFHAAIWDVMADSTPLTGGQELIPTSEPLRVRGLWIILDKHVRKNDPRFYCWNPALEPLPPGRVRPETPPYYLKRVLYSRAPADWVER